MDEPPRIPTWQGLPVYRDGDGRAYVVLDGGGRVDVRSRVTVEAPERIGLRHALEVIQLMLDGGGGARADRQRARDVLALGRAVQSGEVSATAAEWEARFAAAGRAP